MTLKGQMKLVAVAFFGSFFASVSGVGPGAIFNSVLVQLDMNPAVASATGMYCTLYTTLASSINLIINEKLNLEYSLLINILTIIGSLPGLYGQGWIVQKAGGRTQFTVVILLSFLLLILVASLPISITEIQRAKDDGQDVTSFTRFCE